MGRFDYLMEKISRAPIQAEPFRHIWINDFFSPGDFDEITGSPEVRLKPVGNDEELIERLQALNYKAIPFPGTTTDLQEYLKWHRDPQRSKNSNLETCEGMGVTMRLMGAKSGSILEALNAFFISPDFLEAASRKFGLALSETNPDTGLQKYLDGYEISPHPDIRLKAMTYMINVNPAADSPGLDFHTHYMKFRPERAYVEAYWAGNPDADRCWVPWSWCETKARQTPNNSLVMFSPANDTLHAVKASYDHRATQRTQFYGNLWYRQGVTKFKPNWRDYEIKPTRERKNNKTPLLDRLGAWRKAPGLGGGT